MVSCILRFYKFVIFGEILCEMIIRRYTGYSAREYYIIEYRGNALKLRKQDKKQSSTEAAHDLVESIQDLNS